MKSITHLGNKRQVLFNRKFARWRTFFIADKKLILNRQFKHSLSHFILHIISSSSLIGDRLSERNGVFPSKRKRSTPDSSIYSYTKGNYLCLSYFLCNRVCNPKASFSKACMKVSHVASCSKEWHVASCDDLASRLVNHSDVLTPIIFTLWMCTHSKWFSSLIVSSRDWIVK